MDLNCISTKSWLVYYSNVLILLPSFITFLWFLPCRVLTWRGEGAVKPTDWRSVSVASYLVKLLFAKMNHPQASHSSVHLSDCWIKLKQTRNSRINQKAIHSAHSLQKFHEKPENKCLQRQWTVLGNWIKTHVTIEILQLMGASQIFQTWQNPSKKMK